MQEMMIFFYITLCFDNVTPTSQPSTGSFQGLFENFVALGAAVVVMETFRVYLLDVCCKEKQKKQNKKQVL